MPRPSPQDAGPGHVRADGRRPAAGGRVTDYFGAPLSTGRSNSWASSRRTASKAHDAACRLRRDARLAVLESWAFEVIRRG